MPLNHPIMHKTNHIDLHKTIRFRLPANNTPSEMTFHDNSPNVGLFQWQIPIWETKNIAAVVASQTHDLHGLYAKGPEGVVSGSESEGLLLFMNSSRCTIKDTRRHISARHTQFIPGSSAPGILVSTFNLYIHTELNIWIYRIHYLWCGTELYYFVKQKQLTEMFSWNLKPSPHMHTRVWRF